MRITPVLAAVAALALVGCDQGNPNGIQNSAATRTVGGAVAGALVADATGGSKTRGALIGAVLGGGSCAVTANSPCY